MFSSSKLYIEDLDYVSNFNVDWEEISNSKILITGATGLIGTFLIDALMYKNKKDGLNIKIFALSRNVEKIEERFSKYYGNPLFVSVQGDVSKKINVDEDIDFIINLASNTHPVLYAAEPIKTIDTIVSGTRNILELAARCGAKRVLNTSSVEIYGENRGDVEAFSETYCGYINCNTLRAGYTEGKRLSEALCQAYIKEKGIDVLSMRLGRVYGPTLLELDSKGTSQFICSAVNGKDIVLKSKGLQRYSYVYVADAVIAYLVLLTRGLNGSAYNISNDEVSDLKGFAGILAEINNKKVIFEIPDENEKAGHSVVQVALMDSSKVKTLGWRARYKLKDGLDRTVAILKAKKDEK